jgi:hypothetical protein
MTDKKAAYNFPGFICSRWRNTKHITENFLGQLIVVPERIAIDTSAIQCDIMRQSLRCGDKCHEKFRQQMGFQRRT